MRTLIIAVLVVAGIAVRYHMENHAMNADNVREAKASGETYSTTLTIRDDPTSMFSVTRAVASDSLLDHRVAISASNEEGAVVSSAHVGDSFHVRGFLVELPPYLQYLHSSHVVGTFTIEKIVAKAHSGSPLDNFTRMFRSTIARGCTRLEVSRRGICEGILIGEGSHIPKEKYALYRQSQLSHLLVASGSNIAFLVGFLDPLLSRMKRRSRDIALVILSLTYCAAIRFEPSILRATAMVIIPAIFSFYGYELSKIFLFTGTIGVCLLLDPFLIGRVGFWLSLSAAAGLVFVAPRIKPYVKSTIIANTLGATVAVQPALWLAFGFSFPSAWWVSVIAVACVEPMTTIGMGLMVIVGFVSSASPISTGTIALWDYSIRVLDVCAYVGASAPGKAVGWILTVAVGLAYTGRVWKAKNAKEPVNNGSFGFLYYRR